MLSASASRVVVYVDASVQQGVGGWAAVLVEPHSRRQFTGVAFDVTSQAMELQAVIEALKIVDDPMRDITIRSDSEYLVLGARERMLDWEKRGWRTKQGSPVANLQQWLQIRELAATYRIVWEWIPREDNAEADRLASSTRRAAIKERFSS